jgi:hypothetical protein
MCTAFNESAPFNKGKDKVYAGYNLVAFYVSYHSKRI